MKKRLFALALTGCITLASALPAFAGEWKQDSIGWWYQNDDGTYPVDTWQWIDGNGDGTLENYYFDADGYCLIDTVTPDGLTVNETGALVIDGMVQTQTIPTESTQPTASAPAVTEKNNSSDNTIGATVWLSATGTKFHRINNCGRMNPKKARQVSREDAIAAGYTPCSKCY